jgi:hypothetical protein
MYATHKKMQYRILGSLKSPAGVSVADARASGQGRALPRGSSAGALPELKPCRGGVVQKRMPRHHQQRERAIGADRHIPGKPVCQVAQGDGRAIGDELSPQRRDRDGQESGREERELFLIT